MLIIQNNQVTKALNKLQFVKNGSSFDFQVFILLKFQVIGKAIKQYYVQKM